MPDRRELIDRVEKTEREYYAMAHAVSRLQAAIREGHDSLPKASSPRDLASAATELEATYLIRVWAEFETALRSFRRQITGDPDDRIGTKNLIEWAAGVKQGRRPASMRSVNTAISWSTSETTPNLPPRLKSMSPAAD